MLALLAGISVLWAADAAAQIPCTVTISMTDPVTVASLQFNVSYNRPDVEFVGTGAGVSCTNLVPGGFPSVTDDDSTDPGVLDAAYLHPTGFTGTQQLLLCDIDALFVPSPADFTVQVTDASDPLFQPVVPLPTIEVTNVNCSGTTTSSTTTTTFGGTTTTLAPGAPMPCTVEFDLDDPVALGSLQFNVDYLNAPGEFDGSGSGVQCQGVVPFAFTSSQDRDGNRVLTTAVISLAGFSGPITVTRCDFSADFEPIASDFQITVTDAADTNIIKLNPYPSMSVGTISCPLGGTTSTTLMPTTTSSTTTTTTTTSTTTSTTTTSTTTSTTTTTLPAVCGDGSVEGSEACDDGNADNTDSCVDTCELNYCGDGFVHAGVEQCDEGAANSNADPATCRSDCTNDDVCGDADINGAVTAVDGLYVLQAAVGLISDCALTRCDATGDGVITVADSQRILFVAVNLPANLECTLPLSLYVDGAAVYGSLSVAIDYAATGESFLGEGGSVDCSDMSGGGAVVSFDNDAAGEMLTVDLTSVGGVGGPTDLAVCRFRGRDVPDATEFSVTVTDARDAGGQPVTAPMVTVSY